MLGRQSNEGEVLIERRMFECAGGNILLRAKFDVT